MSEFQMVILCLVDNISLFWKIKKILGSICTILHRTGGDIMRCRYIQFDPEILFRLNGIFKALPHRVLIFGKTIQILTQVFSLYDLVRKMVFFFFNSSKMLGNTHILATITHLSKYVLISFFGIYCSLFYSIFNFS